MYFMMFAILWGVAFLIACCQFIIIVATCTWYFNENSDMDGDASISAGIKWIFRYHMGSLALGSLLIALVWAVRIIFEYLKKKSESSGAADAMGAPMRALMCMISCCLACLNKIIEYINRNAYIQIALASENFCMSAWNAIALMMKHAAKFVLVEGIGNIFNALGKMAIASSTAFIGFLMIYYWKEVREKTPQYIAPLLVIFMVGFIVGSVFVSVYSTSSNTILQCYLVDLDVAE